MVVVLSVIVSHYYCCTSDWWKTYFDSSSTTKTSLPSSSHSSSPPRVLTPFSNLLPHRAITILHRDDATTATTNSKPSAPAHTTKSTASSTAFSSSGQGCSSGGSCDKNNKQNKPVKAAAQSPLPWSGASSPPTLGGWMLLTMDPLSAVGELAAYCTGGGAAGTSNNHGAEDNYCGTDGADGGDAPSPVSAPSATPKLGTNSTFSDAASSQFFARARRALAYLHGSTTVSLVAIWLPSTYLRFPCSDNSVWLIGLLALTQGFLAWGVCYAILLLGCCSSVDLGKVRAALCFNHHNRYILALCTYQSCLPLTLHLLPFRQ